MIKIHAIVRDGDLILTVTGHAGYAPHGQDIVCAAISAITHTSLLGLESIAENYPGHVQITIDEQ